MLTLYDYDLSGNCYKVRLLLNMLELPCRLHAVDFYPGNETESEDFLAVNPLGELPVLVDADFSVRDSQAILVYLASRYDPSGLWYPVQDSKRLARVTEWLAFAESITRSASAARLATGFFFNFDLERCQREAHRLFRVLDGHLYLQEFDEEDWLVAGDHPTIADLACFPYVALSEEGGVSRQDYPSIRRWLDRVKRLPRFSVMPGIFPAGRAL